MILRLRHSFKALIASIVLAFSIAGPLSAQDREEVGIFSGSNLRGAVSSKGHFAIVDIKRIIQESKQGLEIRLQTETAFNELQIETDCYDDLSLLEENRLSVEKAKLTLIDFDVRRSEFNKKINERRDSQDGKGKKIENWKRLQQEELIALIGAASEILAKKYGLGIIVHSDYVIWADKTFDISSQIVDQVNAIERSQSIQSAVEFAEISVDDCQMELNDARLGQDIE